jgi:SAM-dependent methyltransferase
VWESNPALRCCYADWYRKISEKLPDKALGPWVELGSGPGFSRDFIPGLMLTDIVKAPWHDRAASAESLPFADDSVGALVLLDVLHHLAAPARFFAEATRVLRPGGRVVLCEPYIGPLSYVPYRFFHEEAVDLSVDPFGGQAREPMDRAKDPFASNQATPTLAFSRDRGRAFSRLFPSLAILSIEHLSGLSYAATGGFSRRPLLPLPLWKAMHAFENKLPAFLFRILGFRLLVVIERRS